MTDSERPSLSRGTAVLLVSSAFLLVVYLLTSGRVYTWDTIAYAGRLDGNPWLAERWPSTRFFHPQHLLYFVVAYPFQLVLGGLGVAGSGIRVLQIMSAVFGAGAAFLVGWILERTTGSPRRAVVGALGFGLTLGAWRHATSVEVVTPAAFFFLLGLLCLVESSRSSRHVVAGLFVGLALLIHQLVVLPAVGVALALMLRNTGEENEPSPRARALRFSVAWLAPSAVAYAAAGFGAAGVRSLGGLLQWIRGDGASAPFAPSFLESVLTARRPLANTFVSMSFPSEMNARWDGSGGIATVLVAVLLLALAGALAFGSVVVLRSLSRASAIFPGIMLGLVLIFVYNLAENPWNEDQWFYAAPLGWLLIGFRLPRKIPPPPAGLVAAVVLVLVLLGATNLVGGVLPMRDADRAHYGSLIEFAEDHFATGDILINGPFGPVVTNEFVYLAYFCEVDALRVPPPGEGDQEALFRRRLSAALGRSPGEAPPAVYASEEAIPTLTSLGLRADDATHVASLRGSGIYKLSPSASGGLRGR